MSQARGEGHTEPPRVHAACPSTARASYEVRENQLLYDPQVEVESAKKNSRSTTSAFTDWKLSQVRRFRDNVESRQQQDLPDMQSVPDEFYKVFERRQLEFC